MTVDAKSLYEAARLAHKAKNHPKEESFNRKAQQILKRLLELARDDEWAASFLENVERRIYSKS